MSIVVALSGVSVRAPRRDAVRASLTNVTLKHGVEDDRRGVLAIIGAAKDGTSLLFDVIDGGAKPKTGHVSVSVPGGGNNNVVARISIDAPLPDALRVEEICDLAADIRGEPRRAASERLGILGVAALAKRRSRSLSLEERRSVSLAIALSSSTIAVLLVEEPLIAIDPVAPRLIIDALRERGQSICVIVTTASPRDAMRLGDHVGILTNGVYAPVDRDHALASSGACSVRVVITPAHGRSGATKLIAALSNHDGVTGVDMQAARTSGAIAIVVTGRDLIAISKAITHAVAVVRVDVELIEPITLPIDALRLALAARAASPPLGSLPPQSLAPSSIIPTIPPASAPPTTTS